MVDLKELVALERDLESAIAALGDTLTSDEFKRQWIAKDGRIKPLFAALKNREPDERQSIATILNGLKDLAEAAFAKAELKSDERELEQRIKAEYFDLSLPSRSPGVGTVHPITRIERRIAEVLRPFGFQNIWGPEIETEYYCFDSLNIPKHHPARDMQDTFYTETGHVLRTHTTSVQARILQRAGSGQRTAAPVKVASFGRVYRNEAEDASHQSMFHQFELIWVEKGMTLAHLLGLIEHILKELYGRRRKVKFVPKFYPYTEPSVGSQVDCVLCKTQGCPSCGHAGWVTVGGAGMIHRNVLQEFGFDPSQVSGLAFGLGTSRLAAQAYEFPDLRTVYANDLRILKELV